MSQIVTIQHNVTLRTTECYKCGVIFGIPSDLYGNLLNNHNGFYCPNGHCQSFVGETDAEKYQRLLQAEQSRHANTQLELLATQKSKQRLEKRIKNGVCPCCHHQFVQLTRHMKSKHPDFVNE